MNNVNGDLDKKLSNISILTESHKILKHSMKWIVSKSNIEKNIATVGKYVESDWIYQENSKYYYLIFYPNGQDESSKGLSFIKIVFYEAIPENALIEGNMIISGKELNVSKRFEVKSFVKEKVLDFIETEFLRIHTAESDLIIHCSLKHNTHFVECEFDSKKAINKQIEKKYVLKNPSKFFDVTINFRDNGECKAIKAYLINVPYFRDLFNDNDNESSFDMSNTEITKRVFDEFLHYLYTDDLPDLDFKLSCELYALAHFLKFSELKSLCFTYLSANLTVKNVLVVLKIAHSCSDTALKKECFQFIKESDPDTLARESVW